MTHTALLTPGLAALLIGVASTIAPALWAQDGPPPARVIVEQARTEILEVYREVLGEVRSPRRSLLAAEEPGRVAQINVDEGDEVGEDAEVALLDNALAEIAARRARAVMDAARGVVRQRSAELAQAQRDLARFEESLVRDASSEREIDTVATRVQTLQAQLEEAQADLARAQADADDAGNRLAKMRIVAPFRGVIAARRTEKGEWLNRGDTVVELVSLENLEARLSMPETFLGRIQEPSQTIRVRVTGLRLPDPRDPTLTVAYEIEGSLIAIVPDVDPLTRQFPVRVSLRGADPRIRPGMSVRAMIPTGDRSAVLTIHRDAILRDDAGEFVFIDAGGRAMPVRVRSRYAVGERVAIDPGQLRPGTRVIVEGNERLYATQPLIALERPSADEADDRSR